MYLCNCWLIYYCPYYKPKNQSIGLFPPKFYICRSVVVICISYIICVIYYYICFNNISYIPTCWSFFIYTHIHVYDLSICPSYIYMASNNLGLRRCDLRHAPTENHSGDLRRSVMRKSEVDLGRDEEGGVQNPPVGWWLYRMGPPSYKLVYKPWNNPHEYYNYIYHKP